MHSTEAEPILYERPGIGIFSVAAARFAGNSTPKMFVPHADAYWTLAGDIMLSP